MHAIPEHLRGVFMMRRYANWRLPLPCTTGSVLVQIELLVLGNNGFISVSWQLSTCILDYYSLAVVSWSLIVADWAFVGINMCIYEPELCMIDQSRDRTMWLQFITCTLYRYHMTSIYDISVYEGLSRVIQRLIPQQPALERLLNGFALVSKAASESFHIRDCPMAC